MFKLGLAILSLSLLAACADDRESRDVGTLLDPLCMPDGSPIYSQYSNTEGNFDTSVASKENCPWYDGDKAENASE
ncbi:MAG: hypothetical protein AAF530_08735 [Pseudomonadota bacterium]